MRRLSLIVALVLWASAPAHASESVFDTGGKTICVIPDGELTARGEWAGRRVEAREGALVIGGRRFTACDGLPGPHPSALAVFNGALFVGFRGAGLHRFVDGGFERVAGLPIDGVRALAVHDATLWIGLGARGVYISRDGHTASTFRHWVLGRRGVTGMAVQGDRLEVGLGPYGWWRVVGTKVERVEKHVFAGCFGVSGPAAPVTECALGVGASVSGLPSGHITALAHHQTRLYVGTFDGGLALKEGESFRAVEGAPRFINALLSDGEVLWIASPRGLYRLDGRGVRRADLPLPSDHVNGLALGADGTVWVATSRGLAGFSARGMRQYTHRNGLPGRIVYAVAVTDDGAIWAGTDRGAARFSAEGVTVFSQANGTLTHDWINALLADGDGVYAGTYDAGVVRLTADGQGRAVPGLETAWVNPAGLSFRQKRLTVSTLGDGYLSLAPGEASMPTRRAGLPSNDVTASIVHRGALYIGTRGGLAMVRDR